MLHYFRVDTETSPPPESPASLAYAKRKGIGHDKLAINPAWAECVAVGWALDDGEIQTTTDPQFFARALWDAYQEHGGGLRMVAHNAQFDIGVLWKWLAMSEVAKSGVGLMRLFASMADGKPWDRRWICTSKVLGIPYTLDQLAHVLCVPGKSDDIGALFWKIYAEDPARAMAYLRGDVECLRNIHKRLLELGMGKVQ